MKAGRAGEFASYGLAQNLKELGFSLGRMKTGTPPRLHKASIDFSAFEKHEMDDVPMLFSYFSKKAELEQMPSYIGHTNRHSHAIMEKNLKHSALYGGMIKGVSARYCPSFEDKIVRFPDRDRHQIILEPEGIDTKRYMPAVSETVFPWRFKFNSYGRSKVWNQPRSCAPPMPSSTIM